MDRQAGWRAKARICCCGNFEEETIGHDAQNRAEVPATYEMKTMLTLAELKNWEIGALDIKTAFLYAELNDKDDGVYVVNPPQVLVRHGFVKPGKVWKLKKSLCGLAQSP